ncbi:MAG: Glutamate--tRNA ligase [Syntrophus sp. SKADARSKE-3]|nr:Glutamate--tRNA ligase [Syntrophus sp. SKADARSKE-3]
MMAIQIPYQRCPMDQNKQVRTRFAPSPTGFLHIGGARTALFNWLYARHHQGVFVLRVEDTDQQRSTDESTKAIIDAMTWMGLTWDEGPIFQAQRVDIHREMIQKLINEGKAYYCTCSPDELDQKRKLAMAEGRKPKYDGTCRDRNLPKTPDAVVRFRCPDSGITVVRDLIKGNIIFNNEELDDLVIERSDGYPTYNFAVVVDDAQMGITHVLRGDDHVNNSPRQILLYEALGYEVPLFGHVPMILGSDKARLSKRHGATSVMAYKDMGYLPEALVNYLVRLSWSHGDQEIFTMEELIDLFSLDAVGKSPAVFNPEKLLWLNQHYIREYPLEKLVEAVSPFWKEMNFDLSDKTFVNHVVTDLRSRAKTVVEMADAGRFYFNDDVAYEVEASNKFLTPDIVAHLQAVVQKLPTIEAYSKEGIEQFLRLLADEQKIKLKVIAQPLRVALTGKTVSPGIDEIMITLGKDRTIGRIQRAIDHIQGASG